jgi:adenine-specific DNA-methyltransferase
MCTAVAEKKYMQTVPIGHRKEFAQFFTPVEIAQFMSKWILQNSSAHSILEPAFGLGIFSRVLLEEKTDLHIIGYDIDSTIFQSAQSLFASQQNVSIVMQDYLQSDWESKYDGIICNPPYLKFHDYDNIAATALIKDKLGYSLSGFTNLYAIFLLKSINQLKENGRCAYIVPSEFMNSDYGIAVKRYLIESKKLRHIIVFDFEKDVFEDAITTACIILCSNDPTNKSVSFSCIKTENQLDEIAESLFSSASSFSNEIPYSAIDQSIKWRNYYAGKDKQLFHNLVPFNIYAKVSRGIATGANKYFSFNNKKVKEYNIPKTSLLPCICHCTDIKSHFFDDKDFEKLQSDGKSVFLFNGQNNADNENVRKYIQLGEDQMVHKKFLTASRTPWYALEKRLPPHIWVTVFNREGLRFIRNTSKATNLTTFHSIYVNDSHKEFVDLLYAYLLTNTAHKIFEENRREYGNGLKKFEPNDLNSGKILDISIITKQDQKLILIYLEKYKNGDMNAINKIDQIVHNYVSTDIHSIEDKGIPCSAILEQYPNEVVCNSGSDWDNLDYKKNLLISLVKADNFELFLDGSAKSYYTGKKFPSTIALNKLYYFMPYMKGLGVRDLYLIKIARVGTRKEGQPDNDPNDFRLIFEIDFIKQLFQDYQKVHLDIWQTFKDTTLAEILSH